MTIEIQKAMSAAWEQDRNTAVSRGRVDDAYELGFIAAWRTAKAPASDQPVECIHTWPGKRIGMVCGECAGAKVMTVLGMTVPEIARLKAWFESKSSKNITEFWDEAFNAGIKTALRLSKPAEREAQQPVEFTKIIRKAVEEGNAEYWRPSNEHDAALREWKLGGFKGEEPARKQTNHGSIIDCISASVNQILSPYLSARGRESSGVHGYEISGNTIYIGPMRPDRVKVSEITCTIDWDETYTEESKARRIRDAERICRGLDHE